MKRNLTKWYKKDKAELKWKKIKKNFKNKFSNYRNISVLLNSNIGKSRNNMRVKF